MPGNDKKAFKHALLSGIIEGLMRRYKERVPDVDRVVDLLVASGYLRSFSDIENDHIAFRTMGVEQLGVKSLEKIFLHCGYERKDRYFFEGKHLNAWWYAPPSPEFPRVFISELRVGDFPDRVQQIVRSYTDEVSSDPVDSLDLDNVAEVDTFLHSGLWRMPTWEDYEELGQSSEYAAWVINNRYYLNHFTISVHNLPDPVNNMGAFVDYLEKNGFKLNNAGGVIKVSADGLLLQSSTVAQTVEVLFPSMGCQVELHEIPGSYVEFAERRVLEEFSHLEPADIRREHRRDGFEAASADKIFESTWKDQTGL